MIKHLLVILLFAFSTSAFSREVVNVPSTETGFFANSDPTRILLWSNPAEQNIIVFFPGGDGSFPFTQAWPREKSRGLSRIFNTVPNASGAFVNSPYSLGLEYSASRRFTEAHIARMISALETIKQKTNQKIWLYGHSNGSITAFEVYSALQKSNNAQLVNGIIVSGARDIIRIPNSVNVPVLFIHHRDDACADTPLGAAQRNYDKVKERSTARTQFSTVTTYIPPAGHPCLTGVHMFDNTYDELATIIDKFINQ